MFLNIESFRLSHLITRWLLYRHLAHSQWRFLLGATRCAMAFFELFCGRVGGKPCGDIVLRDSLAETLHAIRRACSMDDWLSLLYVIHDLGHPLLDDEPPQASDAELKALNDSLQSSIARAQAMMILHQAGASARAHQEAWKALQETPIAQWQQVFAPFVALDACLTSWIGRMHHNDWQSLDGTAQHWLAALWWMHCAYYRNNLSRLALPVDTSTEQPISDWLSYMGTVVVSNTPKNRSTSLYNDTPLRDTAARSFVERHIALAVAVQALLRYEMHVDYPEVIVVKAPWCESMLSLPHSSKRVLAPEDLLQLDESASYHPLQLALRISPWLAASWLRWLGHAAAASDTETLIEGVLRVDQIWGLEQISLEPESWMRLRMAVAQATRDAGALQLAERMHKLARESEQAEQALLRVRLNLEERVARLLESHGDSPAELSRALLCEVQAVEHAVPLHLFCATRNGDVFTSDVV